MVKKKGFNQGILIEKISDMIERDFFFAKSFAAAAKFQSLLMPRFFRKVKKFNLAPSPERIQFNVFGVCGELS